MIGAARQPVQSVLLTGFVVLAGCQPRGRIWSASLIQEDSSQPSLERKSQPGADVPSFKESRVGGRASAAGAIDAFPA